MSLNRRAAARCLCLDIVTSYRTRQHLSRQQENQAQPGGKGNPGDNRREDQRQPNSELERRQRHVAACRIAPPASDAPEGRRDLAGADDQKGKDTRIDDPGNRRRRLSADRHERSPRQREERRGLAEIGRIGEDREHSRHEQCPIRQRPGGEHGLGAESVCAVGVAHRAGSAGAERAGGDSEPSDHRSGVHVVHREPADLDPSGILAKAGQPAPPLPEPALVLVVPEPRRLGPDLRRPDQHERQSDAPGAVEGLARS